MGTSSRFSSLAYPTGELTERAQELTVHPKEQGGALGTDLMRSETAEIKANSSPRCILGVSVTAQE